MRSCWIPSTRIPSTLGKGVIKVSTREDEQLTLVSLCVIARNEQRYLPQILADIEAQDYPHERIEVVLIDSDSDDNTKELMEDFRRNHIDDYADVLVLDNPKRYQPSGWNVAISGSHGDVLIRIDAHASIPRNYVGQCLLVLGEGEDVCGGPRPTEVKDPRSMGKVIHAAEESAFGSNIAEYRSPSDKKYVPSVFHGAYRREVFSTVGGFDERLRRTEDNEFHYRLRKGGFRIRFDKRISSVQYVRPTVRSMLKQKWSNGYWIGRTLYIEPRCFRVHHFVPLLFVCGIIMLMAIGLRWSWIPFLCCAGLYAMACMLLSIKAIFDTRLYTPYALCLPFLFYAIHLSYGLGTLVGLLTGWMPKNQNGGR